MKGKKLVMMGRRLLVMNLGATSTKIAVYEELRELYKKTIHHGAEEFSGFNDVWEQKDCRKSGIIRELHENGFEMEDFDLVVCRGSAMKPVPGGIYVLNEDIISDLKSGSYGVAASSVGNLIAYEFGREYGMPVITADPPATDELCAFARYTGLKEIRRRSAWHALNQKRTARAVAAKLGRAYEALNLIVAHLGSGISVAAHEKGRAIDVNNALDGDGPFAVERAGTVPASDLIKLCYSGKYSEKDMMNKIKGDAGLMAHLGTKDGIEVERRIEAGDAHAREVFEAMAYQVSKEIGAMASVLGGGVDAVVLTGSLAYSDRLVGWIKERVSYIAEIHVVPGENEMISLAENGLRYLSGEERAKNY